MTSKSSSRLGQQQPPPSFHAGPVAFITFDQVAQQFKVEDFACKLLSQISGKIAVISVAGDGKDTLLNRLIGVSDNGGFEQVIPSHPSDIWMWGQPVQLGENFYAILVSCPNSDPKSIATSLALSSSFVFIESGPRIDDSLVAVSQIEQVLRGGPNDATPPPKLFAVFKDEKCGPSKILDSGEQVKRGFPNSDCWTIPANFFNVDKLVEAVYVSSIEEARRSNETDFVFSGLILVQLAQQYCHLLNLAASGQDASVLPPSISIPSLNEAWNSVVQLQLKSALREAIGAYRSILSEDGMKKLPLTDGQIESIHLKAKNAAKFLIPRHLVTHLQRMSSSSSAGLDANATTGDVNESLTTTDVGSWELFSREFKIRRSQLLDHLKNENAKVATDGMEQLWIELVKSRLDPLLANSRSSISLKAMTEVWDKIVADFHKQCVSNFPESVFTEFVIRSMIPSILGLSVNCVGGSADTMITRVGELEKERLVWTNRVVQLETQLNDQKSFFEDVLARKENELKAVRDMFGSPTPTLGPEQALPDMVKIREILSQLQNSESDKKLLQIRADNEQNLIQLERRFNKHLNEARRKNELLIDNVKINYEAEINQLKDQRGQLFDTIKSLESQVAVKQVEADKMAAIISANENDRVLRSNFANVINQQSELVLSFLKNKTTLDHHQIRELENLRAQANRY